MQVSPRLTTAVIFAGLGIGWALWTFSQSGGSDSVPLRSIEVTETVESALGQVSFDAKPNSETSSVEVDRAVQKASASARMLAIEGAITSTKIADLIVVFDQVFRSTIAPDFNARCEMMRARGDTWAGAKLDGEQERWTTQAELTRNARFSIDQLEVRVLYKAGVRVAIEASDEGFSTVMARPKPGRMPISMEPDEGMLDVIEIRLPMEKGQVVAAGRKGKRTVLVGYQFAWSEERMQWIPWLTCVYANPNDIHYAIYF